MDDDLSGEISRIQLGLSLLGLSWESERVRVWVDRAGRAYLRGCMDRGEKCPMPPPYPTVHWLPPVLVRALAQKLWAEVESNGHSGGDAGEPGGTG